MTSPTNRSSNALCIITIWVMVYLVFSQGTEISRFSSGFWVLPPFSKIMNSNLIEFRLRMKMAVHDGMLINLFVI